MILLINGASLQGVFDTISSFDENSSPTTNKIVTFIRDPLEVLPKL